MKKYFTKMPECTEAATSSRDGTLLLLLDLIHFISYKRMLQITVV